MKPILEGLQALGAGRLMALGTVGIGMLVMLALLALHGGAPSRLALLYADLDMREASQIADALDRAHIAHEEPGQGDRVLVPATEVARARLLLAKDGLPSGGSIGYEIFDRGDAMTSTQFQQEINETRALEGELARSIRMIQGVRQARVHLVLPRRQPFSRETQAAQASVVLTMSGAARLDAQAVQAVLNLVAAAVPGLKPQGIAVVDSRGTVLARAGQPTGEQQVVQTGEELRRAAELRLSRAVEDMLEQSLGQGRVRAEAAVEMNFDHVNETTDSFDPNQQVVRSTQTVNNSSKSTEAEKTVSVQNNLPNADAGAGGQAGSQETHQEETTNYEIGKTVRTLVREQPQIARISLAVMVDGDTNSKGADGKPVWHERSADDLARISRLVQSAIGFDARRGDKVEVVSMRFAGADELGTRRAGRSARPGAGKSRSGEPGAIGHPGRGRAHCPARRAAPHGAASHHRARRGPPRRRHDGRRPGRRGRPARGAGRRRGAARRARRLHGGRHDRRRKHGQPGQYRRPDARLRPAQALRTGGQAPGGDDEHHARLARPGPALTWRAMATSPS